MYTSENNWYSWQYGDDPLFGRQTGNLKFKTHFNKSDKKFGSFGDELKDAARSTLDHYSGLKPSIFFSGGVDSEIVLRTYMDVGVVPEVFIMRYENDINLPDVSYAVSACIAYGIKFHLIDFNLKKFYENDAEHISEQAQIDFPRALPQLKFIEYADGLPIFCSSDPSWYRIDADYHTVGKWISICHEHDIGYSKYVRYLNRPVIGEWFKWTPGLVLSYTKLAWFRRLINDGYYGKLNVNSSKLIGYREVYPDLVYREKLTGFEPMGEFIDEFQNFLSKKYNGLPFRNIVRRTLDEMVNEIIDSSTLI